METAKGTESSTIISAQQPRNGQVKSWAMLVYMSGDNNLTEEMVWGLQEMKQTLEVNRNGVNDKVVVVAQYDPRGLNPRMLLLNPETAKGGDTVDGALEETVQQRYRAKDIWNRISAVEPSPEQIAIAKLHTKSHLFNDLLNRLGADNDMGSEDQEKERNAESFVLELLMIDPQQLKEVLNADGKTFRDSFAPLMANCITKANEPTEEEMNRARALVEKYRPYTIASLETASEGPEDPAAQKLAKRLARSTDSRMMSMKQRSADLMIKSFVKDQAALVGRKDLAAERCLVVLSGHGGGATGDFLPDTDPKSSLSISRLGEILELVTKELKKNIAILGMDSCMMSMAEVCYEVQDYVNYLVGSEGSVAEAGWPYHRVLEVLGEEWDEAKAAKGIVDKYASFYQDYEMGGLSTHLAAVNLKKIGKAQERPEEEEQKKNIYAVEDKDFLENEVFERSISPVGLAEAVQLLAAELTKALDCLKEKEGVGRQPLAEQDELDGKAKCAGAIVRDAILLAHWYAQSFRLEKYVDLYDFCDQLLRFLPKKYSRIRGYCELVKAGVKEAVERSRYCGPDFQHAHGLSVFFPWSPEDFSPVYGELRFGRETGWGAFLKVYLTTTRRLRRGQSRIDEVYGDAEPWRLESDVDLMLYRQGSPFGGRQGSPFGGRQGSPFGGRQGSPFGGRQGSPFGGRQGSPFGGRQGSPFGGRQGSPFGGRGEMGQFGKVVAAANVKNTPDGYFRQDPNDICKFIPKPNEEYTEG